VNYYKPDDINSKPGSFLIIKGVNTGQNISWINDQLIITNESLGSLAVKLGRKYDVMFHFGDSTLSQLRYTGTLNNETIEQVLDILKISSPLDYTIKKREIWIYPDQK
jgi:ferric-dicitrate binding protein FerR (iron transport regulator)